MAAPGVNAAHNQSPPVTQQPGREPADRGPVMGIVPRPLVPFGVPPGLEYLTQIDQILVHQKVELLEAFTGFETNNRYEIKNTLGQKIYTTIESSTWLNRNVYGALRSFDMKIKDSMERDVIRLIRPFRCSYCCFPCCLQEMEVQAPPGTTIGFVKQDWHPFLPKFSIQGPNKETVMRLQGPCSGRKCCGDVNFELKATNNAVIGRISKQSGNIVKNFFTSASNFSISFPQDLEVKMKALLVGACFLIDFIFFEKKGKSILRRGGGSLFSLFS